MSIQINEEQLIFHLQTKNVSYIMKVVEGKYLAHVYWGKKMDMPDMDNAQINRWICFSPAEWCKPLTRDFLCQEYPTGCGTDYRIPAISAVYDDGSRTVELVYEGFSVIAGKPKLNGLPATYV